MFAFQPIVARSLENGGSDSDVNGGECSQTRYSGNTGNTELFVHHCHIPGGSAWFSQLSDKCNDLSNNLGIAMSQYFASVNSSGI